MTTALIAACFTGILRAVGMLLSVIISAEFIYFLLFSGSPEEEKENHLFNPNRSKLLFSRAFFYAKENSVCTPYRFKNRKLIAQALSFIFFYSTWQIPICDSSQKKISLPHQEIIFLFREITILPYTRKIIILPPCSRKT